MHHSTCETAMVMRQAYTLSSPVMTKGGRTICSTACGRVLNKTAFDDSEDDAAAQLIADQARQQFAKRVDRLPIRQLKTALSLLQEGQPVSVTRAVSIAVVIE